MKGFIRRRGDAWELRVYLGTDPVTNKQRYASRTVRTGKREAQRALNEMINEAERGLSVRTSVTVGDLLEKWFEFAAPDSRRKQSRRPEVSSTETCFRRSALCRSRS